MKREVKYLTRGFTLIEFLLYISFVSIMVFAVIIFVQSALETRINNRVVVEVEQQGLRAMQIITQTIRNADGINAPTAGITASSASIDVVQASLDPTIFDILSGVIRIKEGAGSTIDLTSNKVTASGLSFHNLSKSGTFGILRVQFTLAYVNLSGRPEYDYSKTFYGSSAIRF